MAGLALASAMCAAWAPQPHWSSRHHSGDSRHPRCGRLPPRCGVVADVCIERLGCSQSIAAQAEAKLSKTACVSRMQALHVCDALQERLALNDADL